MSNSECIGATSTQSQFCEWVLRGLYGPSEIEGILQDLEEDGDELPIVICEALGLDVGTPYMYAVAVVRAAHAVADHGYTAQWVLDDIQRVIGLLRYVIPVDSSSI